MKKNRIISIMIGLCLFVNNYAQLSNFDLSGYKLPNLERRQLETNFNFTGNNYKINNFTPSNKFKRNNYISNVFINYDYYLNTPKIQRESNIQFEFRNEFEKNSNDNVYNNSKNKSNNINSFVSYNRANRNYFNDQMFFETSPTISHRYSLQKEFSETNNNLVETDDKSQTNSVFAILPLKLGTGRIEQIQDARHAIYLFEELSKINKLSPDKSDEEIIEFAQLISELKNERFFDSRLKRMAELESVDSFLMAKEYVKKLDAEYFATLVDFWDYGNRPVRNSGTRISGVFAPGGYVQFLRNPGDPDYFSPVGKFNTNAIFIRGGFEIVHEEPLNLFWQHTINFNGYAGYINGKVNDKENSNDLKIEIPNVQFYFQQAFGYYPNTRTDMQFGYFLQYLKLFDKSDQNSDILKTDDNLFMAETFVSIDYYISPKMRLNFNASLNYYWQDREMASSSSGIVYFDDIELLLNSLRTNNITYEYSRRAISNNFRVSFIYSIF